MKTLLEFYQEISNIKLSLNSMQLPLIVDGKEVEKVELLYNPFRVEIKTKE